MWCYRWKDKECEAVANDLIKEKEVNRPGGCCSCYPKHYYTRACAGWTLFACTMLISGTINVFCQPIRDYQIVFSGGPEYIETTCTTIASAINGVRLCEATPTRTYSCLNLNVSYTTREGTPVVGSFILWEGNQETRGQQCVVYKSKCPNEDLNITVSSIQTYVGTSGTKFKCYYKRVNIAESVFEGDTRDGLVGTIIGLTLGPLFLSTMITLAVIISCTCGCGLSFAGKPPQYVLEEVEKRKGKKSADPNVPDPAIYGSM